MLWSSEKAMLTAYLTVETLSVGCFRVLALTCNLCHIIARCQVWGWWLWQLPVYTT